MLLICLLLSTTGCSSDQSEIVYNTKDLVITNTYDHFDRLITKNESHLDTGITISYLYCWDTNAYGTACSDIHVVIIDREGNIIGEEK